MSKEKRKRSTAIDGGARASHHRLRKAILGQRLRIELSPDLGTEPGDLSARLDRLAGLLNVCQEILGQVRAELRSLPTISPTGVESGSSLKLLYVDDTARHVRVVQQIANALGYELIVAVGTAEGQRLARHYAPVLDAILLDLDLPGEAGLTLLQQLRAELVGLPILALSAQCDDAHRQAALDAGCLEYLCKDGALPQSLPHALMRLQTRNR